MSAHDPVRARANINPNHDLFHFTIEVGRVVIMLEAAKDHLFNRDWPADSEEAFAEAMDAHLEVCSAYLRQTHVDMKAAEGL